MAKVTDLKVASRTEEYWTKRAEIVATRAFKSGDALEREAQKLFRIAYQDIDKEVQAFYAKYGVITESPTFKTLADGTKVQSGTAKKLVVPSNVANKKLARMTRLEKLQQQAADVLMVTSKTQNAMMAEGLSSIASNAYYTTIYNTYQGIGLGSSFSVLSPTVVNQIINNPVNGQAFSKRIWNNRDRLANTVNQTLSNGIIQGLSNGEMAKRISANMSSGASVAKRLVRTEVTNTLNQAAKAGYEGSGVVSQYQYVATLDNRTSEVCEALDNEIFDLKDAVTGLNYPPMHVNCRSATRAYFDTTSAGLTRMARDLGGKNFTVPSSMSAKDFREIYVDKTLKRTEWDLR